MWMQQIESKNEKRNITTQYFWFVLASFFSLAINFFCIRDNTIMAAVMSALFLLFVFVQPAEDYLYYIVLAIPSSRTMELLSISLSVWICFLYLVKKVIRTKILMPKDLFIPLSLYFLYALQYLIRFNSLMYGLLQPAKMIVALWFLYSYALDKESCVNDIHKIRRVLNIWMLGAFTALLPMLVTTDIIGRLSAYNNDSNMLSIQSVFILACASVIFMSKRKLMAFSNYIVVVGFSMVVCLMCGSRNGFLLLAIVFVSIILFNLHGKRLGKNFFVIAIMIIIIGVAISTPFVQNYLSIIQRRLSLLEQSGDISNGRFSIWREYIAVLNQSAGLWLFGLGTYSFYGLTQMAHNMVLSDIASYGLIGTIIILFAYKAVFRRVYSSNLNNNSADTKKRVFGILPFLVPLIGGITLHSMTNFPNTVMLYIGITIFALSSEERG